MSSHIHTWTDGHLAVRERAYEGRGFVEINSETHAAARWPRTTGADVIAIAAVLDPAVRANGTPGLLRRWRATLADLQREALPAARDTYSENRAFWSTFESVANFLDDVAVSPPSPAIWDALIDHVGEVVELRNIGPSQDGPIAHFDNIKTYDDLYNAQLKFLKQKRGTDPRDQPAGFSGGNRDIPRTTNADVLQLATYWASALADVYALTASFASRGTAFIHPVAANQSSTPAISSSTLSTTKLTACAVLPSTVRMLGPYAATV